MSFDRTEEIEFSGQLPASTISGLERKGDLQRLAPGIYTRNLADDPARIVRRGWPRILGYLLPGAVITDRSAPTGRPVDGVLYVVSPGQNRVPIRLPGLTIVRRPGPGPVDGDIEMPGGAFLASRARGLLDNTAASRSRGAASRTLTRNELGDWIDRLCRVDGEEQLLRYRIEAEALAPILGTKAAGIEMLVSLISMAVSTGPERTVGSAALMSRRRGLPYDHAYRGLAPNRSAGHTFSACHLRHIPGR